MGLESINLGSNSTNPLDVLKELFDNKNIAMKTEVTPEQFKVLVMLKWQQEIKKPENQESEALDILMDKVVPYVMELMVSKNRMSRKEADHILSTIGGFLLQNEKETLGGEKV